MRRFGSLQNRRKEIVKSYIDNLSDLSDYIDLPDKEILDESAWHLFILKLKLENLNINRNQFIEEMEKAGVGCGVHFIPAYRFTYFELILDYTPNDFPYCEESFNRVVSLPLYPDLTDNEIEYVCQTIKEIVVKYS